MTQSNALRRLEIILRTAVKNGDTVVKNGDKDKSEPILLEAMGVGKESHKIVDFFTILSKALEEVRSLKGDRVHECIELLEELNGKLINNHIWNYSWEKLSAYLHTGRVLLMLDFLANSFHSEHPLPLLDDRFLERLNNEFSLLLNEVLFSDLSKELKKFLIERIEDILQAIRRYNIDGTEGLKKATQSFVSDWVIIDSKLDKNVKNNPIWKKSLSRILPLLAWIPSTLYNLIGVVPDIDDYWIPKYEDLSRITEEIENGISDSLSPQEVIELVLRVYGEQVQKNITGSQELKALPPASIEDIDVEIDNEDHDQES